MSRIEADRFSDLFSFKVDHVNEPFIMSGGRIFSSRSERFLITVTLKHSVTAVVGERETLLPAGTRVEWTDDLVVSSNGMLRQFVTVDNRRLLVEEAELTAALP